MQKEKPVVYFQGDATFVKTVAGYVPEDLKEFIAEDGSYEYAHVLALNHPRLGYEDVRTSIVISKMEDGSFETLNTKYVKATSEFIDGFHACLKVAKW
jgi:hypothetical protein